MAQANSPAQNKVFGVQAPIIISHTLNGTQPDTAGNYDAFFIAPFKCIVREVRMNWAVASSSGTVQVEKLTSGQDKDAGTDLLSSAQATSGTADTPVTPALTTTAASLEMAVGDRLGLVNAGTLTSGTNLNVTVLLTPIP